MSIPTRILDGVLVVSDHKQADFATILADATLQAGKRFPVRQPIFGQPSRKFANDRNWAFGAQGYTSQHWETEREISESLGLYGDSYLLGWAFALAMGKVTSTQPNPGGNPTAYQHVIKPFDPSTDGLDMPTTTIYVGHPSGDNLKRRIKSCAVKDVTLKFPAGDMLDLTASFTGSGELVSGALALPPALGTLVKLMSQDLKFEFGPQGAMVDITNELVSGQTDFGFSWKLDDNNARGPGGGLYRIRAWADQADFSLSFQRFVDRTATTGWDDYLADTMYEYRMTINGAQIGAGPETHGVVIHGLAVKPTVQKLGVNGNKYVYQYTVGPDDHIKEGANDVCTVTVINTQASYITAP